MFYLLSDFHLAGGSFFDATNDFIVFVLGIGYVGCVVERVCGDASHEDWI